MTIKEMEKTKKELFNDGINLGAGDYLDFETIKNAYKIIEEAIEMKDIQHKEVIEFNEKIMKSFMKDNRIGRKTFEVIAEIINEVIKEY